MTPNADCAQLSRDALDHAQHGGTRRPVESHDLADLADLRPAITLRGHVQTVGRPAICREGARHRGALSHSPRTTHLCCAWTREARCKRTTAPGRCCRCDRGFRRSRHMITFSAARPRCLPRSTSPPAKSLGSVIGHTGTRNSSSFLNRLDAELRPGGEVHVMMDNYGTHKTPKVARWFARHPRYHVHFTPTSASWLNQVERFLRRSPHNAFAAARSRT